MEELGLGWVGGQIPSLQSQLEQGAQAARRTPLSPALMLTRLLALLDVTRKQ